jgi:hypothetical protein
MSGVNVYRDGKVHVRAEQCDRCLFSPDRLVSGARARGLVESTVGSGPFVCHRNQVSDEPEAICRVWFDRFGMTVIALRWAVIANIITEV